jgi:LmbE family N-acetylglucosaminyl deacetylase
LGLKLLCICAHPDDECFAFGGAISLAAERGVEVSVICLTDGQAATHRGDAASGAELGRMRRQEFARSCEVLGASHYELLDYQDAQLEFADFSRAACRLVERIRSLKPNVVITFGLDGGLNTHPDHTMVSALTNAAFHWAASPKRFAEAGPIHHCDRLYVLSASFLLPDRPAPMPIPWTCTLDIRGVMEKKQEAFRQHTSQAPLMERTRELFEKYGQQELYTLVAAREPQPAEHTTDMFAGLRG